MGGGRLDGLEGEVRGEGPADEIGDGGGEGVDGVEDGQEQQGAEDGVCLGHLGALLKVVEHGVLCELWGVELVLVLGLRCVAGLASLSSWST